MDVADKRFLLEHLYSRATPMKDKSIPSELARQGYSILELPENGYSEWSDLIQKNLQNFMTFHQAWNDLPADNFLGDGGHYRYRRYSVFKWLRKDKDQNTDELTLLPHEPHYQNTYRNNMNGGVYREFEPFKQTTIDNSLLPDIINFVTSQISFNDEKQWRIQAHQFRIVANTNEAGCPTPEGIHRDGADFILIMVLQRSNITGGVSHIYDDGKRLVFGGILATPGDAVLLDDQKVWHGVSEVYPLNNDETGYRDVLVLTFHSTVFD